MRIQRDAAARVDRGVAADVIVDIVETGNTLRENGLEPKRLRLVCHRADSAPSLVLVEGRRGGKPGLNLLPSLILRGPDGSESEEALRIYHRK